MKKLTGSRQFFLYAAIIIISVLSIISAFSIYNTIESLIIKEKGEKAMSVSVAVANLVEQDLDSFRVFLKVDHYEDGNYDAAYYQKMQQIFHDIQETSDVKFIYCCKRISKDEIIYIFDGEDPESELFSPLGSKDDFDSIEQAAYDSNMPSFSSMINDTQWGKLITGVTPIIDPSSGKVIAHIGVDVSAEQIQNSLMKIKNIIFLNSIVFIIVTSLIIYQLLCMSTVFTENDYLTGLRSKGYMERFLEQLIKKSTASGKAFPLIMIDFDDFKMINDEYGHQFGDTVLKSVSDILKVCTRSVDCCARYGGDEFVIILPEANLEYATIVCQWLLKEISSLRLHTKNDAAAQISVSISIGAALWENNMTKEQIMVRADKALYHSKRTGKGKMAVYTEDLM